MKKSSVENILIDNNFVSVCIFILIDNYSKDDEIKVEDLCKKVKEEYLIEDLNIEVIKNILEEEFLLTGFIKRSDNSFYDDEIINIRYKIDVNSETYNLYKNKNENYKQQIKEKVLKNEILKLKEKLKNVEILNNKLKQQVKGLCITNNKRKKVINSLTKNK